MLVISEIMPHAILWFDCAKLLRNSTRQLVKVAVFTAQTLMQLLSLLLAPFHAMYCDALLKSKESMERISNADLIIGDGLYLCSSLIADRFSLPHVVIVTQTLSIPTMRVFGLPMPPAYVPQFRSSFTDRQTFARRLKNLYDWLLVYWVVYFRMTPPFQELKAKYEITPQKGLYETLGRVDLIISQKPLILKYPRPLMPFKLVTDVFPCTVTRCLR